MMGCPSDNKFASNCLALWGLGKGFAGPEGYKSHSAHVLRARGVSITWSSELEDLVGAVVAYCLEPEERIIVRTYYQPQPHPKRNGERVQCNMSLTLAILERGYKKTSRDDVNHAIDIAIGKVSMALGYPPAVWITLREGWKEDMQKRKVCNF